MPLWLIALLQRWTDISWDKVPWGKLWMAAQWLFKAGRAWLVPVSTETGGTLLGT
jgi:hypothetical protein